MKITSISHDGFQTEEYGFFGYDEARSLYFLTEAGYRHAKGRRGKNGQLQDN